MIWMSGAIAFVYGVTYIDAEPSWHRSVLKTLPVALLALAALWAGSAGVALALALCAMGDWHLSHDGEHPFLLGLAAFALGHLTFSLVLYPHWQAMPWATIAALGALAVSTRWWLLPYVGELKIPVAIYVVLISLMGVMAWGQASWIIRWAATSFILSDVLLALGLFRSMPYVGRPLWLFYWLGQAGLFIGLS